MPYQYVIDPDAEAAYVQVTGFVDASTFDTATENMLDDPNWRSEYHTIWDLRRAEVVDVTPSDVQFLVERKLERDEELSLTGNIAMVLNRETLQVVALLTKHMPARRRAG